VLGVAKDIVKPGTPAFSYNGIEGSEPQVNILLTFFGSRALDAELCEDTLSSVFGNGFICSVSKQEIKWFLRRGCAYLMLGGLSPKHREVAKAMASKPQSLLPFYCCSFWYAI